MFQAWSSRGGTASGRTNFSFIWKQETGFGEPWLLGPEFSILLLPSCFEKVMCGSGYTFLERACSCHGYSQASPA
ncbi:hypothetical protein VULLAG_LOCUS20961 [Vulpes lagopus]